MEKLSSSTKIIIAVFVIASFLVNHGLTAGVMQCYSGDKTNKVVENCTSSNNKTCYSMIKYAYNNAENITMAKFECYSGKCNNNCTTTDDGKTHSCEYCCMEEKCNNKMDLLNKKSTSAGLKNTGDIIATLLTAVYVSFATMFQ